MINNPTRIARISLLIALSVVLGPACANQPLGDHTDALVVERATSSHYHFSRVRVEPEAGSISVSGEVARVIPHRGMIPGKVRISLLGADGQLLEQTEVAPMRRNRQDLSAHFYVRLGAAPGAGQTVRLEHSGG
ncbi:hypothetical protein U5801_01610 [Lamprobacter modestohalophilus]|uniref:hypothetical protein n=1 Tax=Lamprobacter modestohalophilus TaxID=1064514 RepID=UPI002ADEDF58|nr:hypothetical protein [Lamprobacter modestohalophilus]MEA1048521.1 hypothetical protein [Lamprobacter modestohalophilus]